MAELMNVTIDVKNLDEVKEYFERYRWHNLKKNPEDLPTERCRVLRANSFNSGIMFYDAVYFTTNLYEVDDYDFNDCKGIAGFYDYDSEWGYHTVSVEAWKYIEPFEEVE